MKPRGYVLCSLSRAPLVIRAGLVLYRFHNGAIVKLISGGYACVYDVNMRMASPAEIGLIERDWRDGEQSKARVDNGALDELLTWMETVGVSK